MTTRHLVAGLDLALDCQIHLDDLEDTRRQVIASGDFALFVLEPAVNFGLIGLKLRFCLLQHVVQRVVSHAHLEPIALGKAIQVFVRQGIALF